MNHYNTSLDFISHEEKQKQKKPFKLHISGRKFLRRFLKTLTVFVLIFSLQIPYSLSFFWDSEISSGNVFASGKLDLGFSSTQTSFDPTEIIKGQKATFSAKVSNLTGLPFKYKQTVSGLDPANELCNNLILKVWYSRYNAPLTLEQNIKYTGYLKDFNINSLGNDLQMRISNNEIYISNPDYGENEHWYKYELSLPTNADPNLGSQSCNFDFVADAVQTNMNFGTGFWDSEKISTSVTTGTWAKVSGMKYNDLNGDGNKDTGEPGLPDWTIYGAKQVQQFNVDSQGATQTTEVLENGKTYLVRVKGTYLAGDGITADARYSFKTPQSTDWTDSVKNYESYGPQLLDLQIDGVSPDWGTYASDHEYWLVKTGAGNALTLGINDIYHPNNTGNLEVTIFKSEISATTGLDGKYTLDLSSLNGVVVIAEEPKSGWQQTAPTKGVYTLSDPSAVYTGKDFGNKEVVPTPDLEKVVINEIYQDENVDGNEWVELYNSGTNPIGLGGWTISDGTSTDTLGDYTLASSGFAVIITNDGLPELKAQIITNNPLATIITLDNSTIGSGLGGDGDKLILKKADNSEMDKVSWGGDHSIFNIANIVTGQSIKRTSAGLDTDTGGDWVPNLTPDPGTNPHSHIQVNLNQTDNNLILGFSNAYGFDLVKYLITYKHLYSGTYIQEAIEGQKTKQLDDLQLILKPFYLGTCSSLGEVCVPHAGVKDMNVHLEYFNGDNTLGTSEVGFGWK